MVRKLSVSAFMILVVGLGGNALAGELATNPSPPNKDWCVPTDTMPGWTKGDGATSHDIYFGLDINDVNDADTTTAAIYRGNFPADQNYFEPGPLQEATTYYWRVDEVGATTVKGKVWSFTTESKICLKIDFGLPIWCGDPQPAPPNLCDVPIPETVKEGWTPWVSPRWADMYDHGTVQLEDIDGTGVSMMVGRLRGGHGSLKVVGMVSALAGGMAPTGSPAYDPLCNSWLYNCDWPDNPWGSIVLVIYNLPGGAYLLHGYHNHFNCERVPGTDNPTLVRCECICNPQPAMPSITAMTLAEFLEKYEDAPDTQGLLPELINAMPEYWDYHGQTIFPPDQPLGPMGDNVTTLEAAYNVQPQQVTTDQELVASVMKFQTDGSAAHVVYEAGCCARDGVRDRWGGRAILNALVLQTLPLLPAYAPSPGDGALNISPDVTLTWVAGKKAKYHDVYLGTGYEDVRDATRSDTRDVYVGRQPVGDTNYVPPAWLEYNQTYYWKVDEVNEPNAWPATEVWSFTIYQPFASNPSPSDGTTDLPEDGVQLGWSAGYVAGSHDLYLGAHLNDVTDATTSSEEYIGNLPQATTTYETGPLTIGQTYYWRVDEQDPCVYPYTWKGDVWEFTVKNWTAIEDFERYADASDLLTTWTDGGFVDNGALVGLGKISDSDPVHGGQQSLEYLADNTGGWMEPYMPYYSEAYRAITDPCDWTISGVKTLKLWFFGDTLNEATDNDGMYVGVEDGRGAVSYTEARYSDTNDMNDIEVAEWYEWNIDLGSFAGGVVLNDIRELYIGFGDRNNHPAPGGYNVVYFDDIRLYLPERTWPSCWEWPTQCHGDADNSGDVKGADFLKLKNSWYKVYPEPSWDPCADFNRDGEVKGSDFLTLKNNWYQTVPADCPPGDIHGIYR
ncbi:MAG: dockerin type I domain-containing protein [Planctomycetota bacterium]